MNTLDPEHLKALCARFEAESRRNHDDVIISTGLMMLDQVHPVSDAMRQERERAEAAQRARMGKHERCCAECGHVTDMAPCGEGPWYECRLHDISVDGHEFCPDFVKDERNATT